jgi:hypothetical protein
MIPAIRLTSFRDKKGLPSDVYDECERGFILPYLGPEVKAGTRLEWLKKKGGISRA